MSKNFSDLLNWIRPLVTTESWSELYLFSVGLLPIPTLLMAFGLTLAMKLPGRRILLFAILSLLIIESITLFLLNIAAWQEAPVFVIALWVIAGSSKKSDLTLSY